MAGPRRHERAARGPGDDRERSRARDPVRGSGADAAAPTIDELWDAHGERLRRLASRVVRGDSRAAEIACDIVMLRASVWLELKGRPLPAQAGWWWLRRLLAEAYVEIEEQVEELLGREGNSPDAAGRRALEGAGKAQWTRAAGEVLDRTEHVARANGVLGPIAQARRRDRQRWREVLARRLRDAPVLALLLHAARRTVDALDHVGRDAWRRVETAVSASAPSGQRAAGLLGAGPGISETAATVTAVLALGVTATLVEPSTPADRHVAIPERIHRVEERLLAAGSAEEGDAVERGHGVTPLAASEDGAEEPVQPSPEAPQGDPTPELPEPGGPDADVEGDPTAAAKDPVQDTPRDDKEGTTYWINPSVRVNVDADGDGADEATVPTPYLLWSCSPPGEQGVAGSRVCPLLDRSGVSKERQSDEVTVSP